jgi:hypothetical protein
MWNRGVGFYRSPNDFTISQDLYSWLNPLKAKLSSGPSGYDNLKILPSPN